MSPKQAQGFIPRGGFEDVVTLPEQPFECVHVVRFVVHTKDGVLHSEIILRAERARFNLGDRIKVRNPSNILSHWTFRSKRRGAPPLKVDY